MQCYLKQSTLPSQAPALPAIPSLRVVLICLYDCLPAIFAVAQYATQSYIVAPTVHAKNHPTGRQLHACLDSFAACLLNRSFCFLEEGF